MLRGRTPRFLAAVLALGVASACGSGQRSEEGCAGDTCDETPFTPDCSTLVDASGRGFLPASLQADPLVSTIYHGPGKTCSVRADEIMQSLVSRLGAGNC